MNKQSEQKKINVWLIEDNYHFRRTVQSLINKQNRMDCSKTFESCEDGLNYLSKNYPPEIILLDINLPGINGIQGIEKIKELSNTTQIIILSVYDDNERIFNALCSGASGYLLKDSSPEKIIDAIEEAVAGGAPMSLQIAHKVLEIFSQLKPKKSSYGLTEREKEILKLAITGLTKQQIADKLFISFHTVNNHLKNIYSKLHVNTRSGAVSKAFKENLI